MKNAILAILGSFALSTAFAFSGAPPTSIKTETEKVFQISAVHYDVVIVAADNTLLNVPTEVQNQLFFVSIFYTESRAGFVYRNVDYEKIQTFKNRQDNYTGNKNTISYNRSKNPPGTINSSCRWRNIDRTILDPELKENIDFVHRC